MGLDRYRKTHLILNYWGKNQVSFSEDDTISSLLFRYCSSDIQLSFSMASSKSTNYSQLPLVHHYELADRMQLEVKVSGSSKGRDGKVEFRLRNSSTLWTLHWGGIYRGQNNWVLPTDHPAGTSMYKHNALQTPFSKIGDTYMIIIEIRDPNICAIEFVLNDGKHGRWLKLNQQNFRIELPETAVIGSHISVPKDLVEHKAYLLWERKGKPRNTPQQQQQDYDNALEDLQSQLKKGLSIDELRMSIQTSGSRRVVSNKEPPANFTNSPSIVNNKRHDVSQLSRAI